MRPWNPLSLTFNGQPIQIRAPAGIRVLGPELTGPQMGMVQAKFASFCDRARLSVVQNVNEHGLLPDGSPYQITLIAGVAQMVVRTAADVARELAAKTGIRFGLNTLLVNIGELESPSSKWEIEDISALKILRLAAPPMTAAEYNNRVHLTPAKTLAGPRRYIYEQQVGRYGQDIIEAVDGSMPFASMEPNKNLFGVAYRQSTATGMRISIHEFNPNISSLKFPEYGATPASPLPQGYFTEHSVLYNLGPIGGDWPEVLISDPKASKNGRKIVFAVSSGTLAPTTDLIVGDYILVERPSGIGAGNGIRYGEPAIITLRREPRLVELGGTYIKDPSNLVKQSLLLPGLGYSPPSTLETIPAGYALPKNRWHEGWLGRYFDDGGTELYLVDAEFPTDLITSVAVISSSQYGVSFFNWWGETGLVKYEAERDEATKTLMSLLLSGAETVTTVVAEQKLTYRTKTTGSGGFDGFAKSWVPTPADLPKAGDLPSISEGYRESMTLSTNIEVSTISETILHLMPGNRELVAAKSTYAEVGSAYQLTEKSNDVEAYDRGNASGDYEYTLDKEHRGLKVFDPPLDLLVYEELITSVSSSGSFSSSYSTAYSDDYPGGEEVTNTLTASGAEPPNVDPRPVIVIQCRGREIRVPFPFLRDASSMDAKEKLRRLYSLYANTGFAPGAPAASEWISDYQTPVRLYRTDLGIDLCKDAQAASKAKKKGFDTSRTLAIRGLTPEVDMNSPAVTYTKTPVTGAGYLTIMLNDTDSPVSRRFIVDASGIRDADTLFPGLAGMGAGIPF